MKSLSLASFVVLLQGLLTVECFAPSIVSPSRTHCRVCLSTAPFMSFLNAEEETPKQKVLKQVERQEAVLIREREKAMKKLNEYEQSLEDLLSRKARYLVQTEAPTAFSETTIRSAVKAFCWRIIAGSVTFITTLKFSGSVAMALKVVGADFFSKSFTMFIGERLMNKSQAGRKAGADDAKRSLAKALIWRLFAICNTLTMAIFVSKDLSVASKIASTDAVVKTAMMFVYERVWARIEWGKEYIMEWNL